MFNSSLKHHFFLLAKCGISPSPSSFLLDIILTPLIRAVTKLSNFTIAFHGSLKHKIVLLTDVVVNKVSNFTINCNSSCAVNRVPHFTISLNSSLKHHIMPLTHAVNKVSDLITSFNDCLAHHTMLLTHAVNKVSNFTIIFIITIKHHIIVIIFQWKKINLGIKYTMLFTSKNQPHIMHLFTKK